MQKKTNKKNRQNVRLATHVTPIEYKLLLKPDLEAHTFEGSEEISLILSKPTNQITLHSKELEITTVSIKEGKDLTQVKNISYDTKAETATFTFSKNIKKGKATLSLSFAGILKDNMRGFYKSQYVLDGKTHTIATTQFEATDARRAFPCFDEPAQKAVFHVKLIVPNDKVAISNTLPNEIREHEADFKIVSFDPTPKMSTYLLAFIVGDFEFLEGKTKDGVLVRIFTTPGKKHQGKFALECAIKSLEFYNDYFAIPYPLKTLDMIAIPDFASGAMENWGAVTYRESALLVDEEHTALANRQWTAVVIAHELAHQWFGNLVTMEWWTHLWLNEGFASYIEYLAVDHMFPKWNIWSQFVSSDHAQALTLDSLLHTHPIEVPVHHPDEISEIFDSISYAKGASVIRMLAQYLGDTMFRGGLRHYLKKHSYKNASTIHLWEAFEKVSKKPVKKLMENWTNKAGYPVVGIEEKGDDFILSQKRYFASPISEKKSKDQTKWMIPFAFSGDREKETQILLSTKTTRLPKTKDLYIKGNPNETGVYRVAYGQSLLSRLHEPIKENRLSEIDRLGVIRDYASFAENGLVRTTDVLELASFYKNETEYVSWMEVLGFLGRVKRIVFGTSAEKDFNQFALGIVSVAAEEIGFDKKTGDDHSRILLRSSLIASAAVYGHKKIIAEAIKRFKNRNQEPLDADIRGAVYGIVARNGGAKEHAMLTDMYKKEPLDEERNRIGRALAQFTQKDLLQKTLAFAISPNVRIQNSPFLVGAVIVNPLGSKLGFSFLQKNWNLMVERYGKGGMMLTRVVSPLGVFTDKKDALAIKKFFKTHPAPGAARTIEQTLEEIYMHAAWKSRDLKKIEKWLKTN